MGKRDRPAARWPGTREEEQGCSRAWPDFPDGSRKHKNGRKWETGTQVIPPTPDPLGARVWAVEQTCLLSLGQRPGAAPHPLHLLTCREG